MKLFDIVVSAKVRLSPKGLQGSDQVTCYQCTEKVWRSRNTREHMRKNPEIVRVYCFSCAIETFGMDAILQHGQTLPGTEKILNEMN